MSEKKINNLITKTKEVLDSKKVEKNFGEGGAKRINEVVKIVESDFKNNFSETRIKEAEFVEETINLLIDFLIKNPIPDLLHAFSDTFFELVFEWGKSKKNNEITRKALLASKTLNLHKESLRAIKEIKKANNKIKELTRFNPEPFKVNYEFLKEMRKKMDDREDISQLNISERIINSLKKEGVKSKEELKEILSDNPDKLLDIKGVGSKSLEEIKSINL